MDAEEVLKLFDSYWFHHDIFKAKSPSSSPPTDPVVQIQEEILKPELFRLPSLHVRSRSDQLSFKTSFNSDSLSSKSLLVSSKLQTIFSGKEVEYESDQMTMQEEIEKPFEKVKGRRKKKGGSKSLSDLEFEELKGFIDLGFVFSEEDRDSSLVYILPGLQRLGKKDGEEGSFEESVNSRPYLSEAWSVLDRRKEQNPLMNWKIPDFGNEIDMKDHLRWWAHTVASTVR